MKKLILSASLALSVAIVGNLFVTHQASATFFAPRGQTQINYGTDVITGRVCTPTSPCDHIYINQGDTVGWKANFWNAGDLEGKTTVTVKNRYFDGTYSTGKSDKPHAFVKSGVYFWNHLEKEPAIIAGAAFDYYYGLGGIADTGQSWDTGRAALTSPTEQSPGAEYCRVAMVKPAGSSYIPYIGASALGFSIPPLPPMVDGRSSTFWPGTMVGPLGPSVYDSAVACAEIAYNYDITPSIQSVDPPSGTTDTIHTPAVTIARARPNVPASDTDYTQWIITQVVVPSDPNDNGSTNTTAPCNDAGNAGLYKTKYGNCKIVAQSGTNSSNRKSTRWKVDGTLKNVNPATSPVLTPNMSFPRPSSIGANDIVCYVLSVNAYQPHLSGSSNWRHSRMVCPQSASTKHPKVQVLGDDARVGGKIDVTLPTQLTKIFGSWGEYASYSAGSTNGFATASGFNSSLASASSQSSWSALTFANTQGQYGVFARRSNIASPGAKDALQYFANSTSSSYSMTSLAPPNTIDFDHPNDFPTGKPVLIDNRAGSTLKIAGGTVQKGQTYIIVATGRVEIANDIRYTGDSFTDLAQIPQVVIIAHDIDIDEAVTNVDAWLITPTQESTATPKFSAPGSGTINTCKSSAVTNQSDLTSAKCNKQLTVNGPVVTDKLLLWRTAGGNDDGSTSDPDPAEKFVNRGDAYLWAQGYASHILGLKTTNMIEQPPRY